MIDYEVSYTGSPLANNETIEWEDLEIELDEELECKFFPSRRHEEAYRLAAVAVTMLVALTSAYRFVGGDPVQVAIQVNRMNSLTCDLMDRIAAIFNGGGTEECVEYEEVPGHRWVCDDGDESISL